LILCLCVKPAPQTTVLKHLPLDNLDGLITLSGVEIDRQVTSDGNGALKVTSLQMTTVKLFEFSDIDLENASLIYRAKIRCDSLPGQAYLEMWCRFPGMGEFFSRGLQNQVTGTMNWISAETPFFLKKGEKPDLIKLNLVMTSGGIVWIDDIQLLKSTM